MLVSSLVDEALEQIRTLPFVSVDHETSYSGRMCFTKVPDVSTSNFIHNTPRN